MNEREFGKCLNQLELVGKITDNQQRKQFVDLVQEMLKMVLEEQLDDDSELYEKSDDALTVQEILDTRAGMGGTDPKEVAKKIEFLIDILNEGDYDDMYGSSGWRDRLGW